MGLLQDLRAQDAERPGTTFGISGLATRLGREPFDVAEELRRFEARGWVEINESLGGPYGVHGVRITAEGRQAAIDEAAAPKRWLGERVKAAGNVWMERLIGFMMAVAVAAVLLGAFWLFRWFG